MFAFLQRPRNRAWYQNQLGVDQVTDGVLWSRILCPLDHADQLKSASIQKTKRKKEARDTVSALVGDESYEFASNLELHDGGNKVRARLRIVYDNQNRITSK